MVWIFQQLQGLKVLILNGSLVQGLFFSVFEVVLVVQRVVGTLVVVVLVKMES